jgi:hypothetical protein
MPVLVVVCISYTRKLLTLFFLQAVNQLCSHFEAYRDVPKITELREKLKNIKKILKSHVYSDFTRYTTNELCLCVIDGSTKVRAVFRLGTASMIIAKDKLDPLVSQIRWPNLESGNPFIYL